MTFPGGIFLSGTSGIAVASSVGFIPNAYRSETLLVDRSGIQVQDQAKVVERGKYYLLISVSE
jgi:hypothetical protein